MTYPHGGAKEIWRDGEGGSHNPNKGEIRDWGGDVEDRIGGLQSYVASEKGTPLKWQVAAAYDFQADANPDHESDAGGYPDQVQIATDIFAEMKTYHPDMNHLIIGGDLKDRWPPSLAEQAADTVAHQTAEEFVNIMRASGVKYISAFSGNHDRDYREYADRDLPAEGDPFYNYKTFFQKSFYYEVWGNNLFIYMGDMGGGVINSDGGSHGIIPDYVFDWYKTVREQHQDKNAFVFTHQWLPNTGMGTSSDTDSDQFIRGWNRFTTHMATYPVAVWVSGHTMGDTATQVTDMHSVGHNGCLFVNAGLHISGHAETEVTDLTYPLLNFTEDSDQLEITRWDHVAKAFVDAGAVSVTLPYEAKLETTPSFSGRDQVSAFDPLEGKRTSFRSIELEEDGSVSLGPYWLSDRIVDDRLGANIPALLEVGSVLQIPGGLDSDADNLVHNYGFGAAWTAQKVQASDGDFSSDIVGYASGPGKDEASRVEAFRGHGDGSLSTPRGLRSHYISDWVPVTVNDSFEFVHNLGTTNFEIVFIKLRTIADGRIFRVFPFMLSQAGFTFEDKDLNTVEIATGGSEVFYRDNTHTGHTVETFDGVTAGQEIEMKISIRKTPSGVGA